MDINHEVVLARTGSTAEAAIVLAQDQCIENIEEATKKAEELIKAGKFTGEQAMFLWAEVMATRNLMRKLGRTVKRGQGADARLKPEEISHG